MKLAILGLPALLLMAAFPFSRTVHAGKGDGGWKTIFDGKTTKGWHSYGRAKADPQWEVKDGAIHLDKSKNGHGDLTSDAVYRNFDLKLEWKISPKGNSGILFYVQEDTSKYEESYYTGPEMQVLDNDGHPDGKIHKHRAGDLYDLIACSKESVKPVGEWNQVEIYSKDGMLKLFLNGVNVVSTTLWNEDWKKMVAGSKFKEWPAFGTFKAGRFCLQDHGNEVWYRNIKIKDLQ
jgi:hypothetical protein